MADKTAIEWTDSTWSPIRVRVRADAFIDEKILRQPIGWKAPRKIFVENQSDLFGEWVPDELIDRVFAIMALCPQHTFQLLTKRPERMLWYCSSPGAPINVSAEMIRLQLDKVRGSEMRVKVAWPLRNVWLGVSCEGQFTAQARIPLLLQTPAAVRFISAEPLQGAIRLRGVHNDEFDLDWLSGDVIESDPCSEHEHLPYGSKINWVIAGGESGPGARPMHPDWARSLRDQCLTAGVPFFFKQWGEWAEVDGGPSHLVFDVDKAHCPIDSSNCVISAEGHVPRNEAEMKAGVPYRWMSRVGKKAAGASLDGREWREFPAATQ